MLEEMMEGYENAFERDFHEESESKRPESIRLVSKQASAASWKTLAKKRIEDTRPAIPLGRRFWSISKDERRQIEKLFDSEEMRKLATMLRSREDDARVKLYKKGKDSTYCIMDVKEAVHPIARHAWCVKMPSDPAERVVEGARHLSPYLGKRMRAMRLMNKAVFVRELLPQDLKIEVEQLTQDEAMKVARFLAAVVGKAHSRQMASGTRKQWQKELRRNRTKSLDAPTWLWTSIVELLAVHERAYPEHCRTFAWDAVR